MKVYWFGTGCFFKVAYPFVALPISLCITSSHGQHILLEGYDLQVVLLSVLHGSLASQCEHTRLTCPQG